MPPPIDLTAAPIADLDWSRGDTPVAPEFDDIYFSTDGGVEETRTVFLGGCGLPKRWGGQSVHHIGELGFGSGLNLLTAWDEFERHANKEAHLHFISIEKFPFTAEMLDKALYHWPMFGDKSERLIKLWPGAVKGLHRLHLSPQVTLTIYIDDVLSALSQMSGQIDSWFLDGFSPSKNPDMWSEEVMQGLARLSHDNTRLATFTVAGTVRSALSKAGFECVKKPGFGRKRHRLEAKFNGKAKRRVKTTSPVIIGAGIAGASLAYSARRYGVDAQRITDDPDMQRAASGNAAAFVKPRLDIQDRAESRFFLSSYLFAQNIYGDGEGLISHGIAQISKDDKEAARFEKLLAHQALPPSHFSPADQGVYFPKAPVINPKAVVSSLRGDSEAASIARLNKSGENWQALDETGKVVAQSETMIIASGAGVREIILEGISIAEHLELRFSRGQLSWGKGSIEKAVSYGGYAIPLGDDLLLGATHDRLDGTDPYVLREGDDVRNLELARKYLGSDIGLSEKTGRASLRVTTSNTLPLACEIKTGLWIMTGLGSRGFSFAPLLAEDIIMQIIGGPNVLTPAQREKFSAALDD